MKPEFESLSLHAELQACFSGEALDLLVEISGEDAVISVEHTRGGSARAKATSPRALSVEHAREIITAVQKVVARPQKLVGDRSTTVYTASIKWKKGGTCTEWSVSSGELEPETVTEIITRFPTEKQELIKAQYADYYNWSHELFQLARKIVIEQSQGSAP